METTTLPAGAIALMVPKAPDLARYLDDHFGALLACLNPRLLSEQAPNGTAGRILLMTRWLRHERYLRPAQPLEDLDPSVLVLATVRYLEWRVQPVGDVHPLLRSPGTGSFAELPPAYQQLRRDRAGVQRLGWRQDKEGIKESSLRAEQRSLRWWVRAAGLDEGAFARTWTVTALRSDTRRPLILSDEQIATVIRMLLDLAVLDPSAIAHAGRRLAWHARQLAAFLVQLWGSFRIGEVGQIKDCNVNLHTDHLAVSLRDTKTSTTRHAKLVRRDDAACPVAAVATWVRIANMCGYDRRGFLLPVVNRRARHGTPLQMPAPYGQERKYFLEVIDATGAGQGTPADGDWDSVRAHHGTHGLRGLLPNRALDRDLPVSTIRGLAGWQHESTFWSHYAAKTPSIQSAQDMADHVNVGDHS